MVGTNPPLCETHICDDEANERIINPKELRVFVSRHSSFRQQLAAQHFELEGVVRTVILSPCALSA
jgi:hypothetical protein